MRGALLSGVLFVFLRKARRSLPVASWRSLRNFRYNYQHHWIWFRQRNC
nr:MAG TPA: hypothetical protein [Caudoviricetes sp.]